VLEHYFLTSEFWRENEEPTLKHLSSDGYSTEKHIVS
jgi:hypothetical protein